MTIDAGTKLSEAGERVLVELIRNRARAAVGALPPDALRIGIGDDCAVTRPSDPEKWDELLTSDAVMENIHFLPDADDAAVGHKAIGRCLSDIAAMGGEPRWALVNLVAPASTSLARIERIMGGLIDTAATHAVALVGGDVAAGTSLGIHVFLTGRVPSGQAVSRHGAAPGDLLFVTGRLGGSAQGRHLSFKPRLAEGAWLREGKWATSMIDLSDGLGIDLRRLLEASGVAGRVFTDLLPISNQVIRRHDRPAAIRQALNDGEDYELLFSVKPDRKDAMIAAWTSAGLDTCGTLIGEVFEGTPGNLTGIPAECGGTDMSYGYEHFKRPDTAD